MNQSYKVRIYPTKEQEELIEKTIGSCRFLYNKMLEERIEKYKNNDKSKFKTEKEYKEEFEFLKEVSSRALQQSRIDLQKAYINFFRRVKKGNGKVGFPKFKKKNKGKNSYREPQVNNAIIVENNKIKLLKLGFVRFRGYKNIDGQIRSVTITKEKSGDFIASILVAIENEIITRNTGKNVGVDVGLKNIAITSEGILYKNFEDKKIENKIKRIQKHIARKTDFTSNRRKKVIKRLNNYHLKRKNKLEYFQWHLVKDIISDNQTICIESLNIKGMMANKKIAGGFHKQSISGFLSKLKQKSDRLGVEIIEADRFYPSSKKCSCCGNLKQNFPLKDRVYECEKCGIKIDRDFNASLNLKALSGEFFDYNHGENVSLILADFSAQISSFLRSDYSII